MESTEIRAPDNVVEQVEIPDGEHIREIFLRDGLREECVARPIEGVSEADHLGPEDSIPDDELLPRDPQLEILVREIRDAIELPARIDEDDGIVMPLEDPEIVEDRIFGDEGVALPSTDIDEIIERKGIESGLRDDDIFVYEAIPRKEFKEIVSVGDFPIIEEALRRSDVIVHLLGLEAVEPEIHRIHSEGSIVGYLRIPDGSGEA